MSKKVVTFGEIMLRLATPGYQRFSQATEFTATFGGGEANVSVSLANYGMESEFVTRLPQNDIARSCEMDLHKHGVKTDHVIYGGDRLGIYFLETGAVARASKVVYDRAHSAIAEIKPGMIDWDKVLKGADWFHWTGITPALSQGAADACLEAIQAANRLGVTVSCDLNYRKNLWKYGKQASEIMPELVAGCDVILGNEEDAEKVFGIKPEGFDVAQTNGEVNAAEFESVCTQLMKRFPRAQKVIITLRGSINANQHMGRRIVQRRETVSIPALRYYPYCGSCRRRRLIHGRTYLRVIDLYRRRSESTELCRSGIMSETYHLRRLQFGNGRRSRETDER